MFCEIVAEHRGRLGSDGLKLALQKSFRNEMSLEEAYAKSAIYSKKTPAGSIWAFEIGHDCFVILRKVDTVRFSTYHVEGAKSTVSVDTMLLAVQEFSKQLTTELRRKAEMGSDYKVKTLTAQLFEDNGKETGLEGRLLTLGSLFKEKFAWREIAPAVITFVTALFLISRGLSSELVRAAIYSILIVIAFTLADMVAEYWWGRAKMTWRLRHN